MPASVKKKITTTKKTANGINISHLSLGLVAVFVIIIGTISVFTRKFLKDRTYLFTPDLLYENIIKMFLMIVLLPCMLFLPSSFTMIRYTCFFFVVFLGSWQLARVYNIYEQFSHKRPNPYFVNLLITLAVCMIFSVIACWIIYRFGSTDFVRSHILYCSSGKECNMIRPLWLISLTITMIVTTSFLIQYLIINHHEGFGIEELPVEFRKDPKSR